MAESELIRLHQFPAGAGLPNASPFCLKLETWLRMAELDYEVVNTPDPRKAPMGKLPMIEHGGRIIADSSNAISYLEKTLGIRMNAQLNPAERATAHALQRMLEEHTYWALMYYRWVHDEYWPVTKETFFGGMNGLARNFVANMMRKKMVRDADGQGLSRQGDEEVQRRFGQDMRALADNLGEKPYFGGYQPATIDAVAFGFVAQAALSDLVTPLSAIVTSHEDLMAWCERMRDRYFA